MIRGNSGSGMTTLAAALQHALGWPTAVIGQDHFRRVVYRERQDAGTADGMEHAALLEAATMHCLAAGHHVVLEGILRADRYSAMLERVSAASDDARFCAFDLTFDETLDRHVGRPEAAEFTPDRMREWYRGWDPLPFVAEERIGPGEALPDIVRRIVDGH